MYESRRGAITSGVTARVAWCNATGVPAMNVPLGVNGDGLPVGVQVAGGYWSEPDLMQFARLVTDACDAGFVRPAGY